MEGSSSKGNNEFEERDPELQAVDRLLHEDGDRFFKSERADDRNALWAQFDRLIERLEREMRTGCENHL